MPENDLPLDDILPETLDLQDPGVMPVNIVNEMEEGYLDYAMSVIVARALPDVRDGLKPVHRRILYAMHELGMGSSAKHKKSARLVGDVLGKYHPHGDSSVYDAMVRMAQEWSMRYPLVDGQGNFGSIDGDGAAAMRYTESRMSKLSPELLADIDKETVIFRDNYDGSVQEPSVLPAKLPNLLLNGVTGIAVGMATAIPPHNLGELVDGIVEVIDNPECTVEDLIQKIPGPDFPTGGIIYDQAEILRGYATGRGKVVIRGKAEIIENEKGKDQIIITEIPYMVNKSNMIIKMAELVNEKIIVGVSDIRDESDRDGIRVVIDLKKDSFPKKILNQMYKMTQLQDAFHMNMIALVGGVQPRLLPLKSIIEEYLKHRKEVIFRRTQFDLRVAEARAHILEGLKIALDHIDEVIATIRASSSKEEAHGALMAKFKLSERQAQAILEMRLQTLAGLERKKIEDEFLDKMAMIADFKDILARDERILAIIRDDLAEMKTKYGDARRTQIVAEGLDGFKNEDLIPNESMIVTLTVGNYVKRMPSNTYKSQHRGGKGIIGMTTKDDDAVDQILVANNHDDLLMFTDRGRVFKLKVYDLPQTSRTAKGQAVVNIIQLEKDEKVTTILALPKNMKTEGKFLFMATTAGTVKKTPLDDFQNVRRSGLIAIKLRDDDLLKWVRETDSQHEIMLITRQGQSIRFKESDVRSMGRPSMGVRGIRLKKQGDAVVQMAVILPNESLLVMTITEHGFGKCTDISEYGVQNRGGSGLKTHMITKKTGVVIGARIVPVTKDGDLLLMSEKGQVIRLKLAEVKSGGRATQGVTVMRTKEAGDKVSSLAVYDSEDDETNEVSIGAESNISDETLPIDEESPITELLDKSKKLRKESVEDISEDASEETQEEML